MRVAALLLVACQAPTPVAAPSGKLVLSGLRVKIAVPPGTRVEEGGGPDAVTLGQGDCVVMLWREDPAAPLRWEDAIAERRRVTSGPGRVREMQREERLSDGGFRLEWTEERESKDVLVHAVQHRIKLGADWFGCGRKVRTPAAQACVRAACESLEPLL